MNSNDNKKIHNVDVSWTSLSHFEETILRNHNDRKQQQIHNNQRRRQQRQRKVQELLLSNISKNKLQQQQQQQQPAIKECDPTADSRDDDDVFGDGDVGILSCGIGQYCMESTTTESNLGGICVDFDEDVDQNNSNIAVDRRNMQEDGEILDKVEELCDYTVDYNDDITCTTCNVDTAAYTANIECEYEESCYVKRLGPLCDGQNDTTFCTTGTIDASLSGKDQFTYEICETLTKPTDFTYCVTYMYEPDTDEVTCEIVVDGITCNSCTPVFKRESGNWCRYFDCDNTIINTSATICDYSIMQAYTSYYLYNQLPCEDGCNLCGDDRVMYKPSLKEFTIPRVATVNCLTTQLTALTGGYNANQCKALMALAEEPCGCMNKTERVPKSSATTT